MRSHNSSPVAVEIYQFGDKGDWAYDAFVTMAASSKADSIKAGVSVDGTKITPKAKVIPKGSEINRRAKGDNQ